MGDQISMLIMINNWTAWINSIWIVYLHTQLNFNQVTKFIFKDLWINPLFVDYCLMWQLRFCVRCCLESIKGLFFSSLCILSVYTHLLAGFSVYSSVFGDLGCLTASIVCLCNLCEVVMHSFSMSGHWWVGKIINLIISVDGKFKETEIHTPFCKLFTLFLILLSREVRETMWKIWWVRNSLIFQWEGIDESNIEINRYFFQMSI